MRKTVKIWLTMFFAVSLLLSITIRHEAVERSNLDFQISEKNELAYIKKPIQNLFNTEELMEQETKIGEIPELERDTGLKKTGPLEDAAEDLGWPVKILNGTDNIPEEYYFTPRATPGLTKFSYGLNNPTSRDLKPRTSNEVYGTNNPGPVLYTNIGVLDDGTSVDGAVEFISRGGSGEPGKYGYYFGLSLKNFLGGQSKYYRQNIELKITFLNSETKLPIPNLKGHLGFGYGHKGELLSVHKDYVDSIYIPPTGDFQGREFIGTILQYDTTNEITNDYYKVGSSEGSAPGTSGRGDLSDALIFTFTANESGEIIVSRFEKSTISPVTFKAIIFLDEMPFRVDTIAGYIEGIPNETENGTFDYVIKQPIQPRSQGFYYETVEFKHKINDKLIVGKEDIKVVDIDGTDLTEYYDILIDENNEMTVTLSPDTWLEAMGKTLYEINVEVKGNIDVTKLDAEDIVFEGTGNDEKTYVVLDTGDASVKLDEGKSYGEAFDLESTTSRTNWPTSTLIEASEDTATILKGEDFSRDFKWSEFGLGPVDLYYKVNGKQTHIGKKNNDPIGQVFTEKLEISKDQLKSGVNKIELYAKNSRGRQSNVIKFEIHVMTQVTVRYLDSYNETIVDNLLLKGVAGVDSYETEKKEFTGFKFITGPNAGIASGKFPADHIVIEYKYKGILTVKASEISFGSSELSPRPEMIEPEIDTSLEINDYLNDDWDIMLAVSKHLADGNTPLVGELQFGKKDGNTITLNKDAQNIYTRKDDGKRTYTITWDRTKGEGVKLQQDAGNIAGHYDGELVWFIQNTPENK